MLSKQIVKKSSQKQFLHLRLQKMQLIALKKEILLSLKVLQNRIHLLFW
jgi:hypothetical protein